MRRLTLALLAASVAASLPLSAATQAPVDAPPRPLSTTLVDVLSADPDYSLLLHLLQRAKLIPTLNKLNDSTFFAPTNHALERHSALGPPWSHAFLQSDAPLADNINEKLRQHLFYHMLNYSVPLPHDPGLHVLHTMHFPHPLPDSPTHEPPPYPPWFPIPGGTLGGQPQLLRLLAVDNGSCRVGVDAFGKGGVKLVGDAVRADNGILLGVGDVLHVPPNLGPPLCHASFSSGTLIDFLPQPPL